MRFFVIIILVIIVIIFILQYFDKSHHLYEVHSSNLHIIKLDKFIEKKILIDAMMGEKMNKIMIYNAYGDIINPTISMNNKILNLDGKYTIINMNGIIENNIFDINVIMRDDDNRLINGKLINGEINNSIYISFLTI